MLDALNKLCNDPYSTNLDKGDGEDMALCYNLRDNNIDMFVSNKEE